MKTALIILLAITGILVMTAWLAGQSGKLRGQRPPELGVQQRVLRPVKPGALNAVSSLSVEPSTLIAPLSFDDAPEAAFARLERTVAGMPGMQIVVSGNGYLYAEAQTPALRFVDDVEFLMDADRRQIHIRSASRLGRRDFGVNRARLERIRNAFAEQKG